MLKGAMKGVGISIVVMMIPIVHFVTGPIAPFIGGFVGGGMDRATPGRAVGIGLLMGLFMASPAILLTLLAHTLSFSGTWQKGLTYGAFIIFVWAGLLGTLGALIGGQSHGRVMMVRKRPWG